MLMGLLACEIVLTFCVDHNLNLRFVLEFKHLKRLRM